MELSLPETIMALLIVGIIFTVLYSGPANAGEVEVVFGLAVLFPGVTFAIGVLHGIHRAP